MILPFSVLFVALFKNAQTAYLITEFSLSLLSLKTIVWLRRAFNQQELVGGGGGSKDASMYSRRDK